MKFDVGSVQSLKPSDGRLGPAAQTSGGDHGGHQGVQRRCLHLLCSYTLTNPEPATLTYRPFWVPPELYSSGP
jgi:hypothetical protein